MEGRSEKQLKKSWRKRRNRGSAREDDPSRISKSVGESGSMKRNEGKTFWGPI